MLGFLSISSRFGLVFFLLIGLSTCMVMIYIQVYSFQEGESICNVRKLCVPASNLRLLGGIQVD